MKNKQLTTKNPYVNKMSLEEVQDAEAHYYYIQVGTEVPSYGGKHTFNQKTAESLFSQMYESLRAMKKEGDLLERKEAHYCLLNFRLMKLRIH